MAKIEDGLLTNESIVYRTTLHWTVMLMPGLLTAFFLLGILRSALSEKDDAPRGGMIFFLVLGVLASGVWLLVRFLKRRYSEYALTTKRVIFHVGAIATSSFEVNLPNIEGIGVEQSLFGKLLEAVDMLGYGSLVINGTGGSKQVFKHIYQPFEFRKQVQGQIGK